MREHEVEAVQQVTLYVDNSLPIDKQHDPEELAKLEKVISWGASLGAFYLDHGYAVRLCVRSELPPLPLLWSPASLQKFLTTLALLPTVSPEVPFQTPPSLPRSAAVPISDHGDSLVVIRSGAPVKFDVDVKGAVQFAMNDPGRQVFQQMLFSKIVPNTKKLGLLDASGGWLRRRYEELGVIEFEDWVDTSEEYANLDAFEADAKAEAG